MRPLVAITSLILLPALVGCQPDDNPDSNTQQQQVPVEVMQPPSQKVTEWDEYTGRFEASKRVEVRPRVSGFVEEVLFKDGEMVSEGQALYTLDKRPFEIALASTKANLVLAQKELDRAKNLRKTNAISQEQLDTRTSELESAQAAYDQAALNLNFSTVSAPISGRIDRTYVDAGNLVSGGDLANTTLTTIVTLDPIYFYFNASERDVLTYVRRNISQPDSAGRGKPWPVEVKLQDEEMYEHKGSIDFVSNTIDRDAGTLEIRARFDNADQFLQPGFFGRLRIAPTEPFDAFVIPQTLIISQGQKKFVYVVGEGNAVTPKYLELGSITAEGEQIVKSGLNASDKIITTNLQMLRPGMQVQIATSGDTAGGQ